MENKIRFFPRNIALWRKSFVFKKNERPYKDFCNKDEFLNWLKNYIDFNNEKYPFYIDENLTLLNDGNQVYSVIQWCVVGWLKHL